MSKTPRVDDREFAAIDLKPSSRVVYASFARQLETELAEARAEIEEHHELVRMCHKRTVEADKLWQKAHNQPDVWPDLGELVSWLMNRIKTLESKIEESKEREP